MVIHTTTTERERKASCKRVSMQSYRDECVPGGMPVTGASLPAYLRYHGHLLLMLLLLTVTLVVADLLRAVLEPLELLQVRY